MDFYPKIKSPNKYRILTQDFKMGSVGATLLAIMKNVQVRAKSSTFGFLAAETVAEMKDKEHSGPTKRFFVYKEMLLRKVDPSKFEVLYIRENSIIFVLPLNRLDEKSLIMSKYEIIFETFN